MKNDNESMYLADSISFEPSKTERVYPKKKLNFLIVFSPKSVQTTLEYFTIFSTGDRIETYEEELDENDEFKDSHEDIVQKVIVCVRGSCYGNNIIILNKQHDNNLHGI